MNIHRIANRRAGGDSTHKFASFLYTSFLGATNTHILNCAEGFHEVPRLSEFPEIRLPCTLDSIGMKIQCSSRHVLNLDAVDLCHDSYSSGSLYAFSHIFPICYSIDQHLHTYILLTQIDLLILVTMSAPFRHILRCPDHRCGKKFELDTWRLNHIKKYHPDLLPPPTTNFFCKRNPIGNLPQTQTSRRSINSPRPREFNANKDPVEDLCAYPYIEHLENIEESTTDKTPPPQPWTETYPNAGAPLVDYIPQKSECDADGCLEDNLRNNPYYPFASQEEFCYVQCGIKKKGMKTYYDDVLREKNTGLHFPNFKNGDGVKKLVAAMPDDKALGEWERHTLLDMRWNSDHPQPIKYWSRNIIKGMRWLLRQPAYAEYLTYAPQRSFSSEGKRLYGEMNTADWWWNEQVRVASRIDYPRQTSLIVRVQTALQDGDTLVPLIFMSDATQLSNYSGDKKEWPMYMTIGNLSSEL